MVKITIGSIDKQVALETRKPILQCLSKNSREVNDTFIYELTLAGYGGSPSRVITPRRNSNSITVLTQQNM